MQASARRPVGLKPNRQWWKGAREREGGRAGAAARLRRIPRAKDRSCVFLLRARRAVTGNGRPSWRTDRREDGEGSEGPLVDRGAVQVATATRGAQAFLTRGTPRTKSHRPSPSSCGTLRSEEIKRRFARSFRRFRNRDGASAFTLNENRKFCLNVKVG